MSETLKQSQSLALSSCRSALSRPLQWISNVSGPLCRLQYFAECFQAMDGAFSFPQWLFLFVSFSVSFTMNLAWWTLFLAVFVVFTFQYVSCLLQLERICTNISNSCRCIRPRKKREYLRLAVVRLAAFWSFRGLHPDNVCFPDDHNFYGSLLKYFCIKQTKYRNPLQIIRLFL